MIRLHAVAIVLYAPLIADRVTWKVAKFADPDAIIVNEAGAMPMHSFGFNPIGGRDLFHEICAPCHGRDMINPGSVTFDLRKFPRDDAARFRKSVLDGKGNAMPPMADKITEDDLANLWAYVRSGG